MGFKKLLGIHTKGFKAAYRNMDLRNSQLEAHTKEVIGSLKPTNGGVSADGWDHVINYITEWNNQTVDSIRLCKQEINGGYKGCSSKKRHEEESRFSKLADQYINNSEEMLQFLVELDSFLKSARYCHDETARVVEAYFNDSNRDGYTMIFKNLKNLRDGHTGSTDQCAKKLLEKLQSLMDKHKKFLEDSNIQKGKFYRKQQKIRKWRKMLSWLVVGSVAAILVCAIVMAVVASPAFIAILAPIVAGVDLAIEGYKWITSSLKNLEDDLKKQESAAESMHKKSRAALADLGDLKYEISMLVNHIEAILMNPESPIDEGHLQFAMTDIKNKLGPLQTTIKKLGDKTMTCSIVIAKGRNKIIKVA